MTAQESGNPRLLTESKDSNPLPLTQENVAALTDLGRRFASRREWWGEGEEEEANERTVIRCMRTPDDQWRVRVDNAIGIIAVEGLQLVVTPKIPVHHLVRLFELSGHFPRLEEKSALAAPDRSFWELVAEWYVRSLERLLRRDLVRDYESIIDELGVVRGRVHTVATGRNYYRGRIGVLNEFDEFSFETPLNRLLRAAARVVLGSPLIRESIRRRARSAMARMELVGELRPTDLSATTDRRTAHYRDAAMLARHVMQATGRTLAFGESRSWTFLIRTPEMVEEGIRAVLRRELMSVCSVEKRGRQLKGTAMTMKPDLVFGPRLAIGDVKYKISGTEWERSDLYQAIAFAAGFRTIDAAIVNLGSLQAPSLPDVVAGNIRVRHLIWRADKELSADSAAAELGRQARNWLAEVIRTEDAQEMAS
jgi:5-methylcytosine-specific restriction enzyme subunit McrC